MIKKRGEREGRVDIGGFKTREERPFRGLKNFHM